MPHQKVLLIIGLAFVAALITVGVAQLVFSSWSITDPRFLFIAVPAALVLSFAARRRW